jgi:hypothetical protein
MPDARLSSLTSVPSVTFDAGQLTSDGGLVWLAQADDRLGLSASFAAQIHDWRAAGPIRTGGGVEQDPYPSGLANLT